MEQRRLEVSLFSRRDTTVRCGDHAANRMGDAHPADHKLSLLRRIAARIPARLEISFQPHILCTDRIVSIAAGDWIPASAKAADQRSGTRRAASGDVSGPLEFCSPVFGSRARVRHHDRELYPNLLICAVD